MAAEHLCLRSPAMNNNSQFNSKFSALPRSTSLQSSSIRASQSMDDKNNLYKELGRFSLRKKIEDSVIRAEMLAPKALEQEEARHSNQEETVRDYNLWDDLAKSNEELVKLADSAKVVDSLIDLTYKAEEAKLITELSDMNAINYGLFEQAYTAAVDVNKLIYKYETSKLLNGRYDFEGACIVVEADSNSEIWAEQVVEMYMKWGLKQGYNGRLVEKYLMKNGTIKSITIEFECKYAFGYLSGEKGVHRRIRGSQYQANLAAVDVIPIFLEKSPDLEIDEKDLKISFISWEEKSKRIKPVVQIQHIPTGLIVHSSGERSKFANKIKALNRLKAKLMLILMEQRISCLENVDREAIGDLWNQESRNYVFSSQKIVKDVKTGVQVSDLKSVLDGNIEPFIGAHINNRQLFDS